MNALADNKVQLQVNMLINWVLPDVEPRCERVIAIDGVNQSAFCIDLESDRALPVLRTFHEILIAIAEGSAIILARDPYSDLLRNDDDFSQAERNLRDRAWRAIRDLLYAAGDDIYFGRERGHHIRLQAGKWGVTRETIYCWLRRYWQRGMTPNALLGDFKNSGRVGPRPAKGPDAPKRGRRSIEEIQIEKETGAAVRKGINMTAEDIAKCRQGIKEFYLKREGYSLSQAYIKTMAKYYIVGHIIDGKNLKPVAAPADERPSLAQFRSEYYKNRDRASDLLARKGKAAAITKRSRIGTRFVTQFGPGMEYELDATPGDTVLVHSITREPIGRPTIYRVHDVFSGMIVGICVTLEPPNWTGAMLVIDNVVSDKVAFCKEYGIEISEQHWPSRYLCRHFSADNGSEWKWYASDNIPELLKAQLHNVAPYRGDLKPIVESTHNAIKQMVDRGLPGNMLVKPDRGERDFRKEPILDLRQYTQLQIRAAIDYNLFHLIKQYPLTHEMIADGVQPYPVEIWTWGVANLGAYYQATDQADIRRSLLPRDEARVTASGIQFRGCSYACEYIRELSWIEQASVKSWGITVAYDPRTVDYIYLPIDDGRKLELCVLTERSEGFRGQSWAEIAALRQQRKAEQQSRQGQIQQELVNAMLFRDAIIDEATKKKSAARKAGISIDNALIPLDGRTDERRQQHLSGLWNDVATEGSPSSDERAQTAVLSDAQINGAEDDVAAPDMLEMLERTRSKMQDQSRKKEFGR